MKQDRASRWIARVGSPRLRARIIAQPLESKHG